MLRALSLSMSGDKKAIYDLSEEELLAIAQGQPFELESKATEASKFIYQLGIKHGDKKISALIIFDEYKKWKGWDQKRQSRYRFFRDFSKYFQSVRAKDGMYYLLNPEPFDLTQEHFFQIKAELRRERSAEKRQKAKKQSTKSRSNKEV